VTTPVRARGETLREVFARTALAVFATAFDPDSIEEREVREVRAHGETAKALLANWINECLYVHEMEGFAWRRIDFALFEAAPRAGAEPMRLHSFLHGEEMEPDRHRGGAAIKGVSVERVSLRPIDGGYEVVLEA
jgi:SHS2 domain-containing protein